MHHLSVQPSCTDLLDKPLRPSQYSCRAHHHTFGCFRARLSYVAQRSLGLRLLRVSREDDLNRKERFEDYSLSIKSVLIKAFSEHHLKSRAHGKPPSHQSTRRQQRNFGSSKHKTGCWRIFNLEVPVEDDPGKDHFALCDALLKAVASFLGCHVSILPQTAFSIIRKSFDARKHMPKPRFVYTVDMDIQKVRMLSTEWKSILCSLHFKPGKVQCLPSKEESADVIALVKNSKVALSNLELKGQGYKGQGMIELRGKEHGREADGNVPRKPALPTKRAKVVVVGSGPAGLFAALVLAESGASVTLVERGQPVETRGRDIGRLMVRRTLQPDSNFCYGEGGAGTWSDGKLTTRIGKNSESVQTVLATLVNFGAPPHILVDGKPHIGTDRLIHILRRFRLHLQSLGVNIMFGTKMEDLHISRGRTVGVHVADVRQGLGFGCHMLESDAVMLAVGHSARGVYEKLLAHNVLMSPKDFAVGFRVEHPQELINEIQYQKWAAQVQRGKGKIPVADYKVATSVNSYRTQGHSTLNTQKHGCYSFCMCPGGQIVPTSTNPLELCINGMSFSRRSSRWANAALVVTVSSPEFELFSADHGPLAGVAFQRGLEKKAAILGGGNMVVPAQTVPDFLENRVSGCSLPPSSYRLGVKEACLHDLFPQHLTQAFKDALMDFNNQMPGFIDKRALLHAVETRTSSPVRIVRNRETFECLSMPGLYPIGEGAGYAGGIVSAAVDGMQAGFVLAKKLSLCSHIPGLLLHADELKY